MPAVQTTDQLSSGVIDLFFARLHERPRKVGRGGIRSGVKASTIRTYGSKLHSFFDWLCVRGDLDQNPIDQGALAKPEYVDKRALHREEIERIFAAVSQYSVSRFLLKRNAAILHVLLFAGLRKTELVSLMLKDVDIDGRTIIVRARTSKSKVTRHIPLTFETANALEDYRQERLKRRSQSEYFWISHVQDTALTAHGLKHFVEALKKQSGVKFHLHRFRHTYACMLGRNNVSAVKIQILLGHRDLKMTQTYLRSLDVEDVRDCVQALSLESLPRV